MATRVASELTEISGVPTVARQHQPPRLSHFVQFGVLLLGAFVFLFPFYYMVIGALQREPNTDISGAFPQLGNLTLDNLVAINQAINLQRTLFNSAVFTDGVLTCALVSGALAGYVLANWSFAVARRSFSACCCCWSFRSSCS